eukprot:TRINITY_DN10762_c0_g1_i1.p1 TRINITY_DN10762_c0_g1~~TRINITY_DN10762_c0_g1_i1.p1  ORF type:complete len:587 (+),score=106.34 TRINITY_DN10762_c0_g1_i1:159-1919(+)
MELTEIECPTWSAGGGSLTTHSQSTENPIVLAQVRDKLLIKVQDGAKMLDNPVTSNGEEWLQQARDLHEWCMRQAENTQDEPECWPGSTEPIDKNLSWPPSDPDLLEQNADPEHCLESEKEFAALIYRHRCKSNAMKELRPYMLFVFVLLLSVFLEPPLPRFDQTAAVRHELVNNPITADSFADYFQSFETIKTKEEFYSFLSGTLVEAFTWSGVDGTHSYWNNFNTLLGGVSIRQLRVPTRTCGEYRDLVGFFSDTAELNVASSNLTCYDIFDESNQVTDPTYTQGSASWAYSRGSDYEGDQFSGFNSLRSTNTRIRYPSGGYRELIPYSSTTAAATAQMTALSTNGFIDKQTRAVIVEFSAYNPVTMNFIVPQLLFEISDAGTIYTQVSYKSVQAFLSLHGDFNTILQFGCKVALVLFLLYFTITTVNGIRAEGFRNWLGHLTGLAQTAPKSHIKLFESVFVELRQQSKCELDGAAIRQLQKQRSSYDALPQEVLQDRIRDLESSDPEAAHSEILANRQKLFDRLIDTVQVQPLLRQAPYAGSPTYLTIFTWTLWKSNYRGITFDGFLESLEVAWPCTELTRRA